MDALEQLAQRIEELAGGSKAGNFIYMERRCDPEKGAWMWTIEAFTTHPEYEGYSTSHPDLKTAVQETLDNFNA